MMDLFTLWWVNGSFIIAGVQLGAGAWSLALENHNFILKDSIQVMLFE